jgi:phosphoserine phosphatase RsbX
VASNQRPRPLEWGAATRTRPGEADVGDLALVTRACGGTLVAAIDGAGHGVEAARAARLGADVLRAHAGEDLFTLVVRCHKALRQTRGAAMSMAFFPDDLDTMTWLGIGDVQGTVLGRDGVRARPKSALCVTRGVVGRTLPPVRRETLALADGDVVVFSTDGIRASFVDSLLLAASPQETAEQAADGYWKPTDDGLVLVVRYLG